MDAELHQSYPACQFRVKSSRPGNNGHHMDMFRRPLPVYLDGPASHGAGPQRTWKGLGHS